MADRMSNQPTSPVHVWQLMWLQRFTLESDTYMLQAQISSSQISISEKKNVTEKHQGDFSRKTLTLSVSTKLMKSGSYILVTKDTFK